MCMGFRLTILKGGWLAGYSKALNQRTKFAPQHFVGISEISSESYKCSDFQTDTWIDHHKLFLEHNLQVYSRPGNYDVISSLREVS